LLEVAVANQLSKRFPGDHLHHKEGLAARPAAEIVDWDDASVLQPCGDLGFSIEAGESHRVSGQGLLDGDRPTQGIVRGCEDSSQAATG
jgi:hypothetical protein